MTETKIEATCETCPWWVEVEGMVADGEAGDWRQCGECRNGQSEAFRTEPECDFWCSEHPDRKLPDPMLHRIAAALEMLVGRTPTGQGLTFGEGKILPQAPTWEEAAMIAEAKRREQGGEA